MATKAAAKPKTATKTAARKTASKTEAWTAAPDPAPAPTAAPASAPAARPMDEKQYLMLLHLSALCSLISIPGVVGPLVMWLVKKDQSPLVDRQGRDAVNFHLTMLIGYVVGIILFIILIGIFVVIAVWIVSLVFTILNAVKANKGEPVSYPMTIRFIRARGQ